MYLINYAHLTEEDSAFILKHSTALTSLRLIEDASTEPLNASVLDPLLDIPIKDQLLTALHAQCEQAAKSSNFYAKVVFSTRKLIDDIS